MGSVPYPNIAALAGDIARAPEQQYAAVRNEQAGLQAAAQERQLRAGQITLQQQQIKDQQAMTAAMQEWNGSDLNQLPGLVIKHGGSANAVLGLKSSLLDYQTKQANKNKVDLENENAVHDQVAGALAPGIDPKQVADADLPNWIRSITQNLLQQGKIDPQHEQTAEQLAQLPPDQARQQLDIIRKGYMGQTALNNDLAKKAEAAQKQSQATLEAAQAEAANYKEDPNLGLIDLRTKQPVSQAGLAPLSAPEAEILGKNEGDKVPLKLKNTANEILNRGNVDKAAMADWLAKNPGKGPSDFLSWKARQSPMAMVMGNQLGNTPALDQAADRYATTGVLPSGFARSPGTLTAIMNRAAELHPGANLAGNQAVYSANKTALGQLQAQFSKVSAFEGTALRNLDLYVQKAKSIPDLQARFANVPLRMITGAMIGEQNYAAMQAARQTAASEVGKVLSSATGSGVLSDTQRKEAQDILDGNLPLAATLQVVETLKQDLGNRHQSYQDEINNLQNTLGGPQGGGTPQGGGGKQGAGPAHDPLSIR